jgi:hypothetical protein
MMTSADTDAIHDLCLELRRTQRSLLDRKLFMEADTTISAIHRIFALAKCHEEQRRPFDPVAIPDLALPDRLRRHALSSEALDHGDALRQAAKLIEVLDRGIWKFEAPRVTSSHLTPQQQAVLLNDVWPADIGRMKKSLHAKGYLDQHGNRTRPAVSFVWRMMERTLDIIHAEHMKSDVRILRMDSELIQLLRSDTNLRMRPWKDIGMIVSDPEGGARPHAVLHPFYVWQIRVEQSAGLFLRENAPFNWIQNTPQPLLDVVAA